MSGVPAPARRLRRRADPASAPRAPANFPRVPPARVYTCSWFCGAGPHSLTCPRVAGRCLSHSPSLQSHPPRVTRTINPSLRDQSTLPRDFGGASARSPALVYTASAAPRSLNTSQLRGRVHTASEMPHLWGRVHTAQGLRDPSECGPGHRPRDSRSAWEVVPRSSLGVPHARRRPRGAAYLARGLTLLSRRYRLFHTLCKIVDGERKCYISSAGHLAVPHPPPFPLFSVLKTILGPNGRPPARELRAGAADRGGAGLRRGVGGAWRGRGTRAPAALPGEALVCD